VDFYGSKSNSDLNLTYVYQNYPYGLAYAACIVKDFIGDESSVVYLDDNLLIDGIKQFVKRFDKGDTDATVLLTKVPNPQYFGIAKFNSRGIIHYALAQISMTTNLTRNILRRLI